MLSAVIILTEVMYVYVLSLANAIDYPGHVDKTNHVRVVNTHVLGSINNTCTIINWLEHNLCWRQLCLSLCRPCLLVRDHLSDVKKQPLLFVLSRPCLLDWTMAHLRAKRYVRGFRKWLVRRNNQIVVSITNETSSKCLHKKTHQKFEPRSITLYGPIKSFVES